MADRTKKPPYVLEDGNIVSHILKSQEVEEQTKRFFSSSPFWRKLQKHIMGLGDHYANSGRTPHTEDRCFLIDIPETLSDVSVYVKSYRSRYGISFKDACIYGEQEFVLTIEVEWEIDHDDFTRSYSLRPIPFDLLTDFSDEKFDAWIKEVLDKKEAEAQIQAEAQLNRLVRKYPELAKKILLERCW